MSFNKNEYGVDFIVGTSFDMSAQTDLQITFLKPDCTTTLVAAATLGTTNLNTEFGLFAANTWAFYTFSNGDLDQSGEWKAQLRYQDAVPTQLYSDIATFNVVELIV